MSKAIEATLRFMDIPIYLYFEEYNIAFTFTFMELFCYSALCALLLYFIFSFGREV